jgi:hypothetical protein
MDKKLIHAVAGSGKTTSIISKLDLGKRVLIITYTENNMTILKRAIINKFGFIPENIKVYTYFTFLYNFALKPQENEIDYYSNWKKSKGIDFRTRSSDIDRFINSSSNRFYINSNSEYYSFRMSRLIIYKNSMFLYLKSRINKYFDFMFIDEVQDFASYDFDFLLKISEVEIPVEAYGDFYQHTFDTSNDGNKNVNLYSQYSEYKKRFNGFYVFDDTTLSKSYRCSRNLCLYVQNNLGIIMSSHRDDDIEIREITDDTEISVMINDSSVVKLFYKENYKYSVKTSDNWGNSKGSTYDNVCVVLNKTTYSNYKRNKLKELNSQTLRKLYVAITRAKNALYFVEEQKIRNLGFIIP